MKKLITLFTVLAFTLNMAIAQEAAKPKVEPKKEVKTEKEAKAKKDEKAQKADAGRVEKNESPAGAPLKKDGTPDKRYKENKEVTPAAGPTKKDGTPDMRYKENQTPVKKK